MNSLNTIESLQWYLIRLGDAKNDKKRRFSLRGTEKAKGKGKFSLRATEKTKRKARFSLRATEKAKGKATFLPFEVGKAIGMKETPLFEVRKTGRKAVLLVGILAIAPVLGYQSVHNRVITAFDNSLKVGRRLLLGR